MVDMKNGYEINIENIIKNPLIEFIPKNSNLNARSVIRTKIEISNNMNFDNNRLTTSIEEGVTLKTEANNRYIKNSFSLDNNPLLKLIKNKEKNDLNYHEYIRNADSNDIQEKIELLNFILDSLNNIKERIDIRYIDSAEFKVYADNKDAVFQNESYLYIQINIENQINESIGFNLVYNKLKDVYNFDFGKLYKKLDILKVPIVPPFGYHSNPIILDNSLAGVLIHEVYGHTLEIDNDIINKKNKLKINSNIEIRDSPLLKSGIVNYVYDDEGIPASENILIKDGKVQNFIHDKESSKLFKTKPTGNGRSESHSSDILPRMSNIIINKGNWNIEEAISDLKRGYYAMGYDGGGNNPIFNNFSISPHVCFRIEKGKIVGKLKNVYISGYLKDGLKNVDIGNKQETISSMCYKKNQTLMVGILSPFLKIDKLNMICN